MINLKELEKEARGIFLPEDASYPIETILTLIQELRRCAETLESAIYDLKLSEKAISSGFVNAKTAWALTRLGEKIPFCEEYLAELKKKVEL